MTPFNASALSLNLSTLGAVLLFGGKTASGYSNSTWIFKNGTWSNLTSAGNMPHLAGAALGTMGNGNIMAKVTAAVRIFRLLRETLEFIGHI